MAHHIAGPWSTEKARRRMGSANPDDVFDDFRIARTQLFRFEAVSSVIAKTEGRS